MHLNDDDDDDGVNDNNNKNSQDPLLKALLHYMKFNAL